MGKFYISAQVDEVVLAETVAPCVASWQGQLPSSGLLRQLALEQGMDFATMALYQAILASPKDRAFIDAVNQQPIRSQQPSVDAKVLIVPALFHGHYPETGADSKISRDVAANCGFDVASIPIKSLAPSSENAAIIRDYLAKERANHIWVFAVSKGSADFRAFLQRYPESPAIPRIRGWVNVCGLPFGCQIADYNLATLARRIKYRAICRLFGVSFEMMRELSTAHPNWQLPLVLPGTMQVYNFSAIPLPCHIQKSLIGRYLAIQHLGPNDGMATCRDTLIDAGPTYPVWGCDHFFRGPQTVTALYRFFSFLRAQCGA